MTTQSTPPERSLILDLNNEFNRQEIEEGRESNSSIAPEETAPLNIVDGIVTGFCFEHVPLVGAEAMKASSLFKVSIILLKVYLDLHFN